MATRERPILNAVTIDGSGNVYAQQYDVTATNDKWKHRHFIFADAGSVRIILYGIFRVPQNYVGTAVLVITWTSQTTSGNVVWDFDYRAVGGDNSESLDQSGQDESVSVTDAAPGAANRRMEVTIALTSGNFAAGDTVEYLIARDISDAADTLAGTVELVDLNFRYSDI